MIKMHKTKSPVVSKKQRKPRKDKDIPKLGTAGKLIGIKDPLNEQLAKDEKENVETDTVNKFLHCVMDAMNDDICCN